MFDFRYHVASLAAVFVALVIGILVGVGLSGRGFVDNAERTRLNRQIANLEQDLEAARMVSAAAARREAAMQDFAADTYPALVPGRLEKRRIVVVYVGSVPQPVDFSITKAVRDAGGMVVRMRALRVPIDEDLVQREIEKHPALREYSGRENVDNLGRELGRELAMGGRTPLWGALTNALVEEREGVSTVRADAIVVARSARPQHGVTSDLLSGLYRGIARVGVPAVGVEQTGVETSAVRPFSRGGLSTVDSIDSAAGRLALVLLLDGAQPGHYGVEENASDGVLPPIEPPPG